MVSPLFVIPLDRLGEAGGGRPAQKLNRCSALVGVVNESAASKFDNRLNAVVCVDQSRLQSPSPTPAELIRLHDASSAISARCPALRASILEA
jgi:hypothetical protein